MGKRLGKNIRRVKEAIRRDIDRTDEQTPATESTTGEMQTAPPCGDEGVSYDVCIVRQIRNAELCAGCIYL